MRLFVSHRPKDPAAAKGEPAKRGKAVPPGKLKEAAERAAAEKPEAGDKVPEIGGPEAPEPTRYGDWERRGIASDF